MQPGIPPFLVIGIDGSLRSHSFHRGLLRAAQDVAPAGMQITTIDLTSIPFYNADVEAQGDPVPVAHFKSVSSRRARSSSPWRSITMACLAS